MNGKGAEGIVHVHCGDSSAKAQGQAGLPGELLVWIELLHEGRIPDAPFASEEYLKSRAKALSESTGGALSPEACRRRLETQDEVLKRAAASAKELVLWFDACLYDQSVLARLLAGLSNFESLPAETSLICVGEFPGKPRFKGLGELSPAELASLFPSRRRVDALTLEEGRFAWEALKASSPETLLTAASRSFERLPFMAEALERRLRQLPSAKNGLPLLDEEILGALEAKPLSPLELFRRVSDMEARPYFGDTTLWRRVNGLSSKSCPPLRLAGPGPLPCWTQKPVELSNWTLALEEPGRKLLRGELDDVALNGIDVELGGIRLKGKSCLRFDAERRAFLEK